MLMKEECIMLYKDAKKLHTGDEVVFKKTKVPVYIVSTTIFPKKIEIFLNDGTVHNHKEFI